MTLLITLLIFVILLWYMTHWWHCWLLYLSVLICCDIWHTHDIVDYFTCLCYFVVIYDTLMTLLITWLIFVILLWYIWHTDDTVDYLTYICYFVVIYDTLLITLLIVVILLWYMTHWRYCWLLYLYLLFCSDIWHNWSVYIYLIFCFGKGHTEDTTLLTTLPVFRHFSWCLPPSSEHKKTKCWIFDLSLTCQHAMMISYYLECMSYAYNG
jgi:hypothetical protein